MKYFRLYEICVNKLRVVTTSDVQVGDLHGNLYLQCMNMDVNG